MMTPSYLWWFLPLGFALTVAIETPVLLVGLGARYQLRDKLFAGVWLNACSYPVVVLALPLLLANTSSSFYTWVAEIFAPLSECLLFRAALSKRSRDGRGCRWYDYLTVVAANLASFGVGELLAAHGWLARP